MVKAFKKGRDDYGIDAMRKKRLTFVHTKAKMLRDYAKTCKREGVESSRVNLGSKENNSNNDSKKQHLHQKKKAQGVESKASLIKLYNTVTASKQQNQQPSQGKLTNNNTGEASNKPRENKDRKDRFRRHGKTGQPMLGLQSKSLLEKIKATVN